MVLLYYRFPPVPVPPSPESAPPPPPPPPQAVGQVINVLFFLNVM